MKRRTTREEAKKWKARWERVNAAERVEVRSASLEVRLRQLGTLIAWVRAFDSSEALTAGEKEVRERWVRFRGGPVDATAKITPEATLRRERIKTLPASAFMPEIERLGMQQFREDFQRLYQPWSRPVEVLIAVAGEYAA